MWSVDRESNVLCDALSSGTKKFREKQQRAREAIALNLLDSTCCQTK